MLLAIATAAALSLWVSALSVRYRDVRYVLPFVMQFWLFASPVAYPASVIAPRWRDLFALKSADRRHRRLSLGARRRAHRDIHAVAVVHHRALLFAGGLAYFFRVQGTVADLL